MRNETTCFRLIWIQNTFSGSVHKYPELLFKRASQPAERVYSTESLEDTVFPVLLRTVKGGSFPGGIRMFHCQLCIFLFVFLRLAACP